MKPNQNTGAKVYAASNGKVVSIYAREPNRSIMIRHTLSTGAIVHSIYAHITNIHVSVGDMVDSDTVIAHLMNAEQLNRYGWFFNHVHFEILKAEPRVGETGKLLSYSVECRTEKQAKQHFYDPIAFLREQWQIEAALDKKTQGRE